jgi:hypothetical protein
MGQWEHGGGFSVDGSVRIEAADRAGRERLLRYCARPPFALDRLRELDPAHLVYAPPDSGPRRQCPAVPDPTRAARPPRRAGAPTRLHRHRYFGVLAPNAPLRTAVTALAPEATIAPPAPNPEPAAEPAHRRAAPHRPRPGPAAVGPARCRGGCLRPPRPAGTRVRVRPAPHLVTTTVDARTCATQGLLAPAPALASVPARNQHDNRAEQPFAAAYRRLTRTTDPTRIRLARLKSLSVFARKVDVTGDSSEALRMRFRC